MSYQEPDNYKLTAPQKLDMLSKIATFWKAKHIREYLEKKYKVSVGDSLIINAKHTQENALIIDKLRKDYLAGILEVPLANKRVRLEQFTELYDNLKDAKEYSGAAKILDYIREEIEGKTAGIQNVYLTQVNLTDEELVRQKVESLERLEQLRRRKLIVGESDAASNGKRD